MPFKKEEFPIRTVFMHLIRQQLSRVFKNGIQPFIFLDFSYEILIVKNNKNDISVLIQLLEKVSAYIIYFLGIATRKLHINVLKCIKWDKL